MYVYMCSYVHAHLLVIIFSDKVLLFIFNL